MLYRGVRQKPNKEQVETVDKINIINSFQNEAACKRL